MKKTSIWLDFQSQESIQSLQKDISVDVLIIGGGITGMSAAYQLRNSHLKVCVVDSDLVGHGVTSKTTGKLTYLQGDVYTKLEKASMSKAKLYLESQKEAIREVKQIVKKEKIDCNFEEVESVVYAYTDKKIDILKKEKQILMSLGVSVQEQIGKDFYALSVSDTVVFHPLKYLDALKKICRQKGVQIYERTKILQIDKCLDGYRCMTQANCIKASKVIVACHYPFFLLPFFLPMRSFVEQSYIVAFPTKFNGKKSAISIEDSVQSYRYYEDKKIYKLYLKNSHNIANHLNRKAQYEELLQNLIEFHPEYVWSNDDLMTVDSLPYIGIIKRDEPNLLIATGYNTWGMTNGTLAGMLLKDMVLGRENQYSSLFYPLRGIGVRSLGQSLVDLFHNGKSFIQNKLFKRKKWYSSAVSFERRDGKPVAIYRDEQGEHIVYNQCPHVGCSLIFNEMDKTWDCPCHASRFDLDGNCIKGPSRYNITYRKPEEKE